MKYVVRINSLLSVYAVMHGFEPPQEAESRPVQNQEIKPRPLQQNQRISVFNFMTICICNFLTIYSEHIILGLHLILAISESECIDPSLNSDQ